MALSASVVVVSPPNGVGEVAAVAAASNGQSVRWFVVSEQANSQVTLAPECLAKIQGAGGSLELAGADVASLLLPSDDSQSSLPAVSSWCGSADSLIATLDGVVASGERAMLWKDAVKVATQEASKKVQGTKVAVLSAEDQALSLDEEEPESGNFVGKLFGGNKVPIPDTLTQAMGKGNLQLLRHGELFGTPESSPDFSPLVGGLRRDAELCEEYQMRNVRVDPTFSVTGNVMMGKSTRSSRHSVGEAAALWAADQVKVSVPLDVCVSSLSGSDPMSLDSWQKEFDTALAKSTSTDRTTLFSTDFASVPDVARLTEWLASKWAPTVLRTYDIAAIRFGERPVYALKTADDTIEIVWQNLVNFESQTVGKMKIVVSDTGVTASRQAGDAKAGFGSVSRKPLNGEDVLVRRLAEAAAQAVDKGLAKKAKTVAAPVKKELPKPVVETVVAAPAATSSESGPRTTGARRSTEKARGKRRKSQPE